MKYALIDTANTFFRARHVASRNADTWEKIGMAMHLTMSSVNQITRMFGVDHVVFCLEGRSWRKDFYPQYKAHRKLDESAMTERPALSAARVRILDLTFGISTPSFPSSIFFRRHAPSCSSYDL